VQFNQIFKLGTALDNSTAAFNSEKPAQKNKDSISLDIQRTEINKVHEQKKENTNLIPKTKSRNILQPVHPPTRRDFSALTT